MHQNDLFQRVVGFRRYDIAAYAVGVSRVFPSLSESSGFPTNKDTRNSEKLAWPCFHLFQRVVGFQLLVGTDQVVEMLGWFPSLSESSGFPTGSTICRNGRGDRRVSISFRE